MTRSMILFLTILALLCIPGNAWACGSRWVINALSQLRLMHFSFFIGLVMGTPLILSKMSDFYRKDFQKLPKLGYFKSLVIVLICEWSFQMTLGLFMDTRGMTDTPAFISEVAKDQDRALLFTQQDFESILKQHPNSK